MPPKPIPDRWIPYSAIGKVIEGTRIICFKVPLRKNVQLPVKEIKQMWDVSALLRAVPRLRAVVDLTNTARYYDPQELSAAGVAHTKILMPGRVIPPEEKVTAFMDAVDGYLERDERGVVGVHCTHGVNRTGYMVCRYLRDRLHVSPRDAIDRFEAARGYKIERDIYVTDILSPLTPHTPPNPPAALKTRSRSPLGPGDRSQHNGESRSGDTRRRRRRHDSSSLDDHHYSYKYDY